jgi:hypothetical protein
VIDRRVAEAADDQAVVRPRRGEAQSRGPPDRERQANGARQVRGDRRRLGNDVQLRMAEHLMPPARHRLGCGCHEAEQHVADAIPGRPGLRRADKIERA